MALTLHTITFVVVGRPRAQGSQETRYVPRLGRAIAHEKPVVLRWRAEVARAARAALYERAQRIAVAPVGGAIKLTATFWLRRGRTVRRPRPTTAPDVDKLARAVLDALSGVLYGDDAQVIELIAVKRYAQADEGATITVESEEGWPTRKEGG